MQLFYANRAVGWKALAIVLAAYRSGGFQG